MKKATTVLSVLPLLLAAGIYPLLAQNASAQSRSVTLIEGGSGGYTKVEAYAVNAGVQLVRGSYGSAASTLNTLTTNGVWIVIDEVCEDAYGHHCFDSTVAIIVANLVKSGARVFLELSSPVYSSQLTDILAQNLGVALAEESVLTTFTFSDGGVLFSGWSGLAITERSLYYQNQPSHIALFLEPARNASYTVSTVKSESTGLLRAIAVTGSIGKGQIKILVDATSLATDTNIDSSSDKQAVFSMFDWLSAGTLAQTSATTAPTTTGSLKSTTTQISSKSQANYQTIQGISNDTLVLAVAIAVAGIAIGVGLSRRGKTRKRESSGRT